MNGREKHSEALSNPELDQDEILDDLESIKELLEEADTEDETRVPLLDDLVDGALNVEERDLDGGRAALNDAEVSSRRFDETLFDSLLADEWKSASRDVLTQARGAIEAHRNQWTPEDTDELNEALRERIDATLTRWLQDTVRDRMHELKAELLAAAEATINERIALLTERERDQGGTGDDG